MSNVRPPDPIDWNSYDDGGSGKELPPKGDYQMVIEKVSITDDDRTREGYLCAVVDAKIVDPGKPWDGFLTRFNRFSTKKWSTRNANPLADYLRGFGAKGPFVTDDDYRQAAMATVKQACRALCDWEIYDSASGFAIRGYDEFPTSADGKKLSVVQHGDQKLYANVRMRFIRSGR